MHWTAPELFLGGCYDFGGLGEDYRVIACVWIQELSKPSFLSTIRNSRDGLISHFIIFFTVSKVFHLCDSHSGIDFHFCFF